MNLQKKEPKEIQRRAIYLKQIKAWNNLTEEIRAELLSSPLLGWALEEIEKESKVRRV